MILWLDAQISPRLCPWIARRFAVKTVHVRDLDLREAEDSEIFDRARGAGVVVFTKDEDFGVLTGTLPDAIELLHHGEPIVEIGLADGGGGRRTRRSTRPHPRAAAGRSKRRSRRGG